MEANRVGLVETKTIHKDLIVIDGKPITLYLENHYASYSEPTNSIVEFHLTPSRLLKPLRSMPDKDKYLWQNQ